MPMYVCVCNAVSERAIREAVEGGVRTFDELRMQTGCATSCGCCEAVAIQVMEQCLRGTGPARSPTHSPRYHTLAADSVR